MVIPDVIFWNSRHEIIKRLEGRGLSALYPEREYADDGGLMAYGPNVPDNFRRAAGYVDRILKGADPGDLPIQQPSRFDFVINMRTARRLGAALPQWMLSSADRNHRVGRSDADKREGHAGRRQCRCVPKQLAIL